ncbi:hypothetical protein GH714_020234 [Hevea brasiliensis]|uniref:RNA cytidine acetyltransferase n=1 Tax=Hevea brasiliensis TaxID=3981 RepID=A0A6A6K7B6_HEVBR|nr:hypothetical protein GH714_020234 [Hevea brasiliensis]
MSLRIGFVPILVASSAKIAKEIMKTHDLLFCGRPSMLSQQKLSYNGLDLAFAPYGSYWKEMRKICVIHLFNSNRVRSFRPIRESEVSHMLGKISNSVVASKPVDLTEAVMSLTRIIICKNIFTGGTDNNAAAVIWAMTFLMKNPIKMKKAQEEVRRIAGKKGFINEDEIQKLSYLKAVVKETMRLQPTIPIIPRETSQHCNLDGFQIPPKTVVHVNVWAIGRDPEVWENPEEFCPERFINKSIDLKGQNFELIPFGAGRRVCPGMVMGLTTVELALANLLYIFDWELPIGMSNEDLDMEVQPGLTMHKKNALRLMARNHKKKRAKQIKKLMQRGLLDPEKVDPFSLFVETGGLTYCLYKDSERILGNTFGMCILQDVHERFRTESHSVVMDDELNILPIFSHTDSEGLSEAERDLKNLKDQLHDDFPVGPLIKKCCTLDQGKAVITFLDAILDKTLRSTLALLAARGRGKSSALGLAVAGAIAAGLLLREHIDYDIVKSANPEFKRATVRINIYKQHRQTIQYIQPHEHEKLSQVELLVVDEAAAIPLPVVKSLLGPYLVFLSSTVNGHWSFFVAKTSAATGRTKPHDCQECGGSLSDDLFERFYEFTIVLPAGRLFKKIELNESIRYASADPIESWLNALLCLDVTNSIPSIRRLPPPSECDLYYVNRDTLFSYHKDSELFLQRMMALYVASHYKNSPNDLQLMADAPAHHLFVLLGPVDESENKLPDILCVIQVSLEGQISRKSAVKSLSDGHQPFGDQIPWKFCEQFRDTVFPSLSGARIVRIATHPSAMKRVLEPHNISVEDDLNEAAKQVEDGMKTKMEGMLNPELLQQYAIVDREGDFENALKNGGKITSGGLISVKSSRTRVEKHGKHDGHKNGKKRKGDNGSKSNKKSKS